MTRRHPFNSIYTQGFLRVATCVPVVEVVSPARNLEETRKLAGEASSRDLALAVFPELGLTAYANEWSRSRPKPSRKILVASSAPMATRSAQCSVELSRTSGPRRCQQPKP